ncbi:MAG TPA: Bax inhibitor-1/YccA family protein [Ktedonobacteraceae bacterium]|nr:Bax inhibitor-1/YccA family protein [Ktedonobacteraceae bacterium]
MRENVAQPQLYSIPRVEVRPLLRSVYLWMTLGLLITAVVAFAVAEYAPHLLQNVVLVWGILIAQLILVIVLAAAIWRLSFAVAALIFVVYAALTGFSLSGIVLYYSLGTLTQAFLSTAALFAVMSIVGITTKADLTKLGTYLIIGLVGIIIAMFINFFLRSNTFDFIISILGVIIFTGLTAYDTQKIARLAADPRIEGEGSQLAGKLSILGALTLYLDFLNLFLFLLRIFGRSQN